MRIALGKTKNIDAHVAKIKEQVDRGLRDGESRQLAVRIVSGQFDRAVDRRTGQESLVVKGFGRNYLAPPGPVCKSRDDACEIERIWDFVVLNLRYVYDPTPVDTFSTLKVSLEAGGADCFPEGTLLLRDDGGLIPVEKLEVGMKIWGRDRWSEVVATQFKGDLPVTAIHLNNGSWLRLTDEHKVYVGICHRHTQRVVAPPCSCPISEREITRVHVSELLSAQEQPNVVLLQPKEIAWPDVATSQEEQDWAVLKGYYLADGWLRRKGDGAIGVSIAGKDGHPKEAQKQYIEEIAARLGFNTSWRERWIDVYGKELGTAFARLGHRAPNKHIDVIPPTQLGVRSLLAGLLADSGRNTHGLGYTFTTTSRALAVQMRVLHRILGISCGYRYIEQHGGLGKHPIYRLNARLPGAQAEKLLRVKEIVRGATEPEAVWDIQTDDHYVYLPEHDVTVSNCDDYLIAFATLLGAIGFEVMARVIATKDEPDEWAHIYPLVGATKDDPTHLIPLDASYEGATPGWEYPRIAKLRDYVMVGV